MQYVSFDDTDSTLRNVICVVPQGSILGPKLFILNINDICIVSPVLKFILFADDTNIFYSGGDIRQKIWHDILFFLVSSIALLLL